MNRVLARSAAVHSQPYICTSCQFRSTYLPQIYQINREKLPRATKRFNSTQAQNEAPKSDAQVDGAGEGVPEAKRDDSETPSVDRTKHRRKSKQSSAGELKKDDSRQKEDATESKSKQSRGKEAPTKPAEDSANGKAVKQAASSKRNSNGAAKIWTIKQIDQERQKIRRALRRRAERVQGGNASMQDPYGSAYEMVPDLHKRVSHLKQALKKQAAKGVDEPGDNATMEDLSSDVAQLRSEVGNLRYEMQQILSKRGKETPHPKTHVAESEQNSTSSQRKQADSSAPKATSAAERDVIIGPQSTAEDVLSLLQGNFKKPSPSKTLVRTVKTTRDNGAPGTGMTAIKAGGRIFRKLLSDDHSLVRAAARGRTRVRTRLRSTPISYEVGHEVIRRVSIFFIIFSR